jgi:hypothetical protein
VRLTRKHAGLRVRIRHLYVTGPDVAGTISEEPDTPEDRQRFRPRLRVTLDGGGHRLISPPCWRVVEVLPPG